MNLSRYTLPATLLATFLLGFAALPATAETLDSSLDSYSNDVLLQNSPTLNHFQLEVQAYTSPDAVCDGSGCFHAGLTVGILHDVTAGTFSDAFLMFCNDFTDDITPPSLYNIYIRGIVGAPGDTPPPPPQGLGLTYGTLQLQALLGANFGNDLSANPTTVADAQADIWNQDGGGPFFTPPNADMVALLAAAVAAQPTANFSNSYLFDVIAPDLGAQSFMPVTPGGFHTSITPTPEPGSLVMFGLGLIGLGGFRLRRKDRK